ncbi:uncharacterized protein BYT42DRAFT_618664 [Radiomyces spectabilis]|uniref:uncharacterized protein n=1 Tax=Radiomyces spectabilis TaxID=64574 RepID=UPI00221E6669|nr:uncharacterized protein BYT42DRAFT_618664 [Radiomyces spectabilis]KAI8365284.1 hypothetical protein BYT42DRAFT_618664 [Radiomyces spectabilis]
MEKDHTHSTPSAAPATPTVATLTCDIPSSPSLAEHPSPEQPMQEQSSLAEAPRNNRSVSPLQVVTSPLLESDSKPKTERMHRKVEDLVAALSQLQQDHARLSNELETVQQREIMHQTERTKLIKRNTVLKERVKKYKTKLATIALQELCTESTAVTSPPHLSCSSSFSPLSEDQQFNSFVNTLRMSGQFGQLVAGALAQDNLDPSTAQSSGRSSVGTCDSQTSQQTQDTLPTAVSEARDDDNTAPPNSLCDDTLHQITSELVSIKLANFEMGQKYEQLCHKYEATVHQLQTAQNAERSLLQKTMALQTELEEHQSEKEFIMQEHEELLKENEELFDKSMATKKTASELQLEKLALAAEIEKLTHRVQDLENEKREWLQPRGTFSEEVFAAHSLLFGRDRAAAAALSSSSTSTSLNRRHTLQLGRSHDNTQGAQYQDEYQAKYIESDLRCRELEKLLAETKVKLAEYESGGPISPRGSLQQQRRTSMYLKRNSTTSLSMLASRGSTPTSPREPRESTDSIASSTTSAMSYASPQHYKRSSMYSRIWGAFGAPVVPQPSGNLKTTKTDIYDEPQSLTATAMDPL